MSTATISKVTPRTDALLERHRAEVADADKACLHELAVEQVRELISHTRQLERELLEGHQTYMTAEQARLILETHDMQTFLDDEETELLERHNPRLLEAYRAFAALAGVSGTLPDNAEAK